MLGDYIHKIDPPRQVPLVLLALYFLERDGATPCTVAELCTSLRSVVRKSSVPRNVSDVLHRAGDKVLRDAASKPLRYSLTRTGRNYVEAEIIGTAIPVREVGMAHVLQAVSGDVRSYVEEAVVCLEANALRAAVVFLWVGAIRHLQEAIVALPESEVTRAFRREDAKAKPIRSVDDCTKYKDRTLLLVAEHLGIIDRSQRNALTDRCLGLRNKCGHPSRHTLGAQMVRGYIEEVVLNILKL